MDGMTSLKEYRIILNVNNTNQELDEKLYDLINFYTNKYGERILAMPEAEGFNMFAWLAPIMIFILGGMVMFAYFKNSPQTVLDVPVSKKESVRFSDEIEAELKDLD